MRRSKTIPVLLILAVFVMLQACGGGDGNMYTFQVVENSGKVAVTGSFSGEDANGDGAITMDELQSFREETPLHFIYGQPADWKDKVKESSLPTIAHGLADLKSLRLDLAALKKGEPCLEMETNTKETVVVSGYHFWRKLDMTDKTKGPTLVNGVGDGTRGLELSMRTLENAKIEVTRD